MRATGPAAGAAHAAAELRETFLYPDTPRFLLFPRRHPADPLVPGERRDVVPYRFRRAVGRNGFPKVRRHHVRRFAHVRIVRYSRRSLSR